MDWLNNICCLVDSYKAAHYQQYPPGTQKVYSYFESRQGAKFSKTLFFGLQYFLMTYLSGRVLTEDKIKVADELFSLHFGKRLFNRAGWEKILHKHGGFLPIRIRAVPEGSLIDNSNVLMTIENTDSDAYWLTNYLETLLVQVWYPCTVATQSYEMKRMLLDYAKDTGDESVDFKLHDFGFRGVTCPEQAALGSAAHLVNFRGTDTVAGLILLRKFYNSEMAGFSIPASEHSTITSWGKEHEVDALRNMLEQYPTGLVACVSDSYDIYKACSEHWGTTLKNMVLERDGVLVIRPDSGHPLEVIPKVLGILAEHFGCTKNSKGYLVLNPKVRVIQGDGIDFEMMNRILSTMKQKKWSVDNIAFGSGGGLLQKLNRDTQRFAFKCSSVTVNGMERDVFKQPITDNGKISKSGRLKLTKMGNTYKTVKDEEFAEDVLRTVFLNGLIINDTDLDSVRKTAWNL